MGAGASPCISSSSSSEVAEPTRAFVVSLFVSARIGAWSCDGVAVRAARRWRRGGRIENGRGASGAEFFYGMLRAMRWAVRGRRPRLLVGSSAREAHEEAANAEGRRVVVPNRDVDEDGQNLADVADDLDTAACNILTVWNGRWSKSWRRCRRLGRIAGRARGGARSGYAWNWPVRWTGVRWDRARRTRASRTRGANTRSADQLSLGHGDDTIRYGREGRVRCSIAQRL